MADWGWDMLPGRPPLHRPAFCFFVPSGQRDAWEGEGGKGDGMLSFFFDVSVLLPFPWGLEISFAGG